MEWLILSLVTLTGCLQLALYWRINRLLLELLGREPQKKPIRRKPLIIRPEDLVKKDDWMSKVFGL